MSGMELALKGYLRSFDTRGDGLDPNEARNAAGTLVSMAGPDTSFFSVFKIASNHVTREAPVNVGAFSGTTGTNAQDLGGENFTGLNIGQHEYENNDRTYSFGSRFSFFI